MRKAATVFAVASSPLATSATTTVSIDSPPEPSLGGRSRETGWLLVASGRCTSVMSQSYSVVVRPVRRPCWVVPRSVAGMHDRLAPRRPDRGARPRAGPRLALTGLLGGADLVRGVAVRRRPVRTRRRPPRRARPGPPGPRARPGRTYRSYVALGDSYTAAPLVPSTDTSNGCLRSSGNYPSLVAAAMPRRAAARRQLQRRGQPVAGRPAADRRRLECRRSSTR